MTRKTKRTTSILFFILIAILTVSTVEAQQDRNKQGPPPLPNDEQIEQMVQDLDKALSLSDEQEKQVSEKYFSHFEVIEKKVDKGRPDREEMAKIKTEFIDDVKSVLSDEQKDQYDVFLKENRGRNQQRKKG